MPLELEPRPRSYESDDERPNNPVDSTEDRLMVDIPISEQGSLLSESTPHEDESPIREEEISPDILSYINNEANAEKEKEFSIDEYPEWLEVWEGYDESDRELLIPIIENKRLAPEVFIELNFKIVRAEEDELMGEKYEGYGGEIGKKHKPAARIDYKAREIILFPAFQKESKYMQSKIFRHEVGHMVGLHRIPPHLYEQVIAARPDAMNGKYIQKLKALKDKDGNEQVEKWEIIQEQLADDLSDYMATQSPEAMLSLRLQRAGHAEDLAKKDPELYDKLLEETIALCELFKLQLDPALVDKVADVQEGDSYQDLWLQLSGLVEDDFMQEVPMDVGEEYFTPPPRQKKKEDENFYSWMFGWLFGK